MIGFCLAATLFDQRRKRPSGDSLPLSFLIPCYNDGSTIRTTIESILESCRANDFEILITDDASTDDSAAVLDECARRYPVQVFRNETNLIALYSFLSLGLGHFILRIRRLAFEEARAW